MTDNAPISVIVPCFNCANSITNSLESILNQTLSPMELIVVDDASTDDSCSVIENLIKKYCGYRIFLIKLKENSGPGIARNLGWDNATQPWVAFLDADDIWHHEKIHIQWGIIEKNPNIDLCGHNSELFSIKKDNIGFNKQKVKKINFTQMLFSNKFPTRSVMLKASIPLRFRGKQFTEDYLLWLEIILDRYNCFKIDSTLAFSLRPEFTAGGYSGQLWKHEKRELNALKFLYIKNKINFFYLIFFSILSFLKYLRRSVKTQLLGK